MGSGPSKAAPYGAYKRDLSPPGHRKRILLIDNHSKDLGGHISHPESAVKSIDHAVALKKISDRKRRLEENGIDEDVRALTADADPKLLKILHLVQASETNHGSNTSLRMQAIREGFAMLNQVPEKRCDYAAILLHQKEGEVYYQLNLIPKAKESYTKAIQLAEHCVARGEKDLYMILKRYVFAMVGLAKIWYAHERDTRGFTLAKEKSFYPPATKSEADANRSLDSSITSGGSIFSLNKELVKSMESQPRRRVGPNITTVNLKNPRTASAGERTKEDEFVLNSSVSRELIASPCELLLLRCCEVVEIGHNRQSELLIPALIELAQIYEDLQLYNRALLLIRRCIGILCVVYDYDHPRIVQLHEVAKRLLELYEYHRRGKMAAKIQATWKMYMAMRNYELILGRPVHRHVWLPKTMQKNSITSFNFLDTFVNELPSGVVAVGKTQNNDELSESVPRGIGGAKPREFGEYPRPPYAVSGAYPDGAKTEPSPLTHHSQGANIVRTTHDTRSDVQVNQTDYGGFMTIHTTTVDTTVSEHLVESRTDNFSGNLTRSSTLAGKNHKEAQNGMRKVADTTEIGANFRDAPYSQGRSTSTGAAMSVSRSSVPVHQIPTTIDGTITDLEHRLKGWTADVKGQPIDKDAAEL